LLQTIDEGEEETASPSKEMVINKAREKAQEFAARRLTLFRSQQAEIVRQQSEEDERVRAVLSARLRLSEESEQTSPRINDSDSEVDELPLRCLSLLCPPHEEVQGSDSEEEEEEETR
jgi:hypothetical protein